MSDCPSTYGVLKVLQVEFVGFLEELRLVHASDVQDEVRPLRHSVAIDAVVLQGLSHDEVHHRMEPQRLFDKAL